MNSCAKTIFLSFPRLPALTIRLRNCAGRSITASAIPMEYHLIHSNGHRSTATHSEALTCLQAHAKGLVVTKTL